MWMFTLQLAHKQVPR